MSRSKLREEKNCLNCHAWVEHRYCPHCGQENINPRKTFHQLFLHFFEDLTHYENSFWKTLKNLIFSPGELTRQYLSGKRVSYLAPIRLYIFISFVTFLSFSLTQNQRDTEEPQGLKSEQRTKSQANAKKPFLIIQEKEDPVDTHDTSSLYQKMVLQLKKLSAHNTEEELREKLVSSFLHNMPKAIMLYMPFFAFFLWLFHHKKKWYYFDHGIFTLHYFSFLLIGFLWINLGQYFLDFWKSSFLSFLNTLLSFGSLSYMIYYFYSAHSHFYGGSLLKNFLWGSFFLVLNTILMGILFLGLLFYSFFTIH